MEEIWKDVVGFEGAYLVSNLGNVKSCYRMVSVGHGFRSSKGKLLKKIDYDGYDKVLLSYKEFVPKKKYRQVHRLVAEAFLEKVEGYDTVNHKDFNKKNNCVDNLEWCNTMMNITHSADNGRMNKAKRIILKEIMSGKEFIIFGGKRVSYFLGYSKNYFDYHYGLKEKILFSKNGNQFSYEIYNYKGDKIW